MMTPVLKKTLIVGDVHGCFKEFSALLEKAGWTAQSHRLILTGDAINGGPYSLKMLKWLRHNKVEMVRGNHEQGFIDGIQKGQPLNPVLEKLKQDMGSERDQWVKFLSALPFYIEEKDFLAVHAGLVPGQQPQDTDPHLLMNIRTWDGKGKDIKSTTNPAWHSFYKGKKLVVYGHWAGQGLHIKDNAICLDSGCVYGRRLSGLLLPERKIIQVPALKNYKA